MFFLNLMTNYESHLIQVNKGDYVIKLGKIIEKGNTMILRDG